VTVGGKSDSRDTARTIDSSVRDPKGARRHRGQAGLGAVWRAVGATLAATPSPPKIGVLALQRRADPGKKGQV